MPKGTFSGVAAHLFNISMLSPEFHRPWRPWGMSFPRLKVSKYVPLFM